jgi:hypothetical protein
MDEVVRDRIIKPGFLEVLVVFIIKLVTRILLLYLLPLGYPLLDLLKVDDINLTFSSLVISSF